MIIDLRFGKGIDPLITPYFDEISYANRSTFNEFIGSFSSELIQNLDWWADNPSSRNTYASPLFHYFCCIHLIEKLSRENIIGIQKIIVDSLVLKGLLKEICKNNNHEEIRVFYKPGFKLSVKRFLKRFIYYEWELIKRLIHLVIVKYLIKPSEINLKNKGIILIDTFILKDYVTNDRWYGNFWRKLDPAQRDKIFFVPTIVNIGILGFRSVSRSLRNDERNFILKEDFLKLKDLMFAYSHKWRIRNISLPSFSLFNLELKDLITEDIRNNRDVTTIVEALLTYRFIFRLFRKEIKLKLSIDWFEGHALDKLWNLAVKKFFPEVKRIGYETFRSFPYYLSSFPIRSERNAETIPDVFAVQGKSCVDSIREFLPEQDVMVIPAFKYQHVWEYNYPQHRSHISKILVALPMSLDASLRIIKLLVSSFKNPEFNSDRSINVVIKPHPTCTILSIKKKLSELPPSFSFTSELSFPNVLEGSSILITEASSTCLEAFAYGIPVVIIENETGLTYDPVPKDVSQDLYLKCRIAEDLTEAILKFLNLSSEAIQKNQIQGKEIRKNYFEKLTREGLYNFLEIEQVIEQDIQNK